jgi:hypothetical protein
VILRSPPLLRAVVFDGSSAPLKDRRVWASAVLVCAGLLGQETERCDVDLMVVGNADFGDVVEKHSRCAKDLESRDQSDCVFSKEFRKKVCENFLKTVLSDKKLFISGDEDDLRELGQK